jgi:hypothetical protein
MNRTGLHERPNGLTRLLYRMKQVLRVLAILLTATPGLAHADEDTNIVAEVIGRFQASKPGVVMHYEATYTLLRIRLMRVAGATLKATEGVWRSGVSNEWIPACLIDFHIASPKAAGGSEEGSVSLFKRTVSVLTLPDLRIITYAKVNDEYIKPFFGAGRRMTYVETYDFQSGGLTYRRHDAVSGAVETNLPGMADLAKQSTEVGDVLRALDAAYRHDGAAKPPVENSVHFNVDGAVRTFALQMKRGRIWVPVLSRKLTALYADVSPKEEHAGRNESFSMWCVPFRAFSRETQDPELKTLGETSLEYSMLPLSGEYSLFLGAIQCTLTSICTQVSGSLPGMAAHAP